MGLTCEANDPHVLPCANDVSLSGLKNGDQLGEASLVQVAKRRLSVGLDPFGMLRSQAITDPLLKFRVGANRTVRGDGQGPRRNRAVWFHAPIYRCRRASRHSACGGFSAVTREPFAFPSFGRGAAPVRSDRFTSCGSRGCADSLFRGSKKSNTRAVAWCSPRG